MKILIEATYQRIPREHWRPGKNMGVDPSELHNGSVCVREQEGLTGTFEFAFTEKKLDYLAAVLHYFVRGISAMGVEFGVQLTKQPPRGGKGVVMGLNLSQVELIYRSEESARKFFAPIEINRGEGQ